MSYIIAAVMLYAAWWHGEKWMFISIIILFAYSWAIRTHLRGTFKEQTLINHMRRSKSNWNYLDGLAGLSILVIYGYLIIISIMEMF